MAFCLNPDKHPQTDLFNIIRIDHLEWTVGDAISAAKVFKVGLGMEYIGHSKKETGNHDYTSYVLQTNDVKFIVSSPLLTNDEFKNPNSKAPHPLFAKKASHFFTRHGNGVSAIGVEVADVKKAFEISTANGAIAVLPPTTLEGAKPEEGKVIIAEILIYNEEDPKAPYKKSDTVLRYIQNVDYKGPFIPGYVAFKDPSPLNYNIHRMDHVVGNVYDMDKIIADIKKWTGMHTFAKFSKEEIMTKYTSLNSEVLSNNDSRLLLPVNEAAPGKAESQILEYLKAYNGPGVQHIALKSNNIFDTVQSIASAKEFGFEFIPTPATYYEDPVIIDRMENHLEQSERDMCKKLGILVDLDEEGILLQIFTKPLFDRPTIFVEIIQRKCKGVTIEIPGCGGFGKGNFKALFESIERLQAERGGLIPTPQQNPC
jgi:4-hydroxyphenylpyruvate dioxygenase